MLKIRTQKAKGIFALSKAQWRVPEFHLVQTVQDIASKFALLGNKTKFARPCPPRPRHGFLNSVKVTSVEQVEKLFKQTLKEEPDGELMLMEAIDASHNVIWRPGLIAVGPGHDGATDGHDSLSIPVLPSYDEKLRSITYTDAGVQVKDEHGRPQVPYIEAVVTKDTYKVRYTQLRGGPEVPASIDGNFIPKDIVVKRVVMAQGDLLEWEKIAATLKPGDIVYHPGGNLASHYFVHCFSHNIPIIMQGDKPKVGTKLKATAAATVPPNAEMLVDGITSAWCYPLENKYDLGKLYISAILTGLHHAPAMMQAENAWYIGVAAGLMLRLGAAAAIGEAKHMRNESFVLSVDYSGTYKSAWSHPFDARLQLREVQYKFKNCNWPGAYGGKAWADCVTALERLDNAAWNLIRSYDAKDADINTMATELVDALNAAVNKAHNTGNWLNKFGPSQDLMNRAAQGDPRIAVNAAPIFYAIAHDVSEAADMKAYRQWLKAEKLELDKHSVGKDVAEEIAALGLPVNIIGKIFWAIWHEDNQPYAYTVITVKKGKVIARPLDDDGYKYTFTAEQVKAGFDIKTAMVNKG